jgi:hypothetical protein
MHTRGTGPSISVHPAARYGTGVPVREGPEGDYPRVVRGRGASRFEIMVRQRTAFGGLWWGLVPCRGYGHPPT